jgi:TRAP-type C4-dicarboxylate transport system substrate-binding protein
MKLKGGREMFKFWSGAASVALSVSLFANAAAAEPVKLIVASLSGGESTLAKKFYIPWAARVQEQSHGTLVMDVRHGYAIASLNNSLDRLRNDVVQVTSVFPASFPGSYPLFEVGGLPFMTQKGEVGGLAMWRLVKSGLLDKELRDVHVIATATFGYSGIHFTKPPQTLDNLQGLKVATASRIQSEMLSLLGAAPSGLTPMDAYPALQRGTFDAVMTSWAGVLAFKLDEVTNTHLDAPLGTTAVMIAMMRKRYDQLPEAGRKAIDANTGEAWSRVIGKDAIDAEIDRGRAQALAKGQKLMELTPAQLATWKERTKPVIDSWLKERPNGGEKVLDAFRKYVAAIQSGH